MPRQIDELFYTVTARTGPFTAQVAAMQAQIARLGKAVAGGGGAASGLSALGVGATSAAVGLDRVRRAAVLDPITGLRSESIKAAGATQQLSKSLVGLKAGLVALPVLFIAASARAAGMASAFDRSLREVSTLLPGTVENVRDLRGAILDLSTEVPQTPELLSRGLYQVVSSGISDTAEAMEVLTVSARAASAGLTDTFTAVDAITTVLNAYQLGSEEATRVSDVFFQTVKEGKIEFPDLAQNIGAVATSAALAGVSIEEVGAALATLTKFGIGAAESTVSLNRLLIGLTQVTSDQQAAAKRLGVEYSLTALQSKGLVGFLQDLEQATGGNLDLLSELNPNIRSARAAFVLAGKGAGEYGRILAETNKAQGVTNDAFLKVTGSAEDQFDVLKNKVNKIWIEFGQNILPDVLAVLEDINRLLESDTETLIRLLEARGASAEAAALREREAQRTLGEQYESTNDRIRAAIEERGRILERLERGGGAAFARGGQFSIDTALGDVTTLEQQAKILPNIANLTVKAQREATLAAIEYGEALSGQLAGHEAARGELERIVGFQRRLLGILDEQVAREKALEGPSERVRVVEDEIDALQKRAEILQRGGDATKDEVDAIRDAIALRENELDLIAARADLEERLAVARASSIAEAQRAALTLTRAAAEATTEEGRKSALDQADAYRETAQALQRVSDLETARAQIGRDTTTVIVEQSDRLKDLVEELEELRRLAADPLDEGFFLEAEIERTQRAIDLVQEGFLELARLREGLVELGRPGEGFVTPTTQFTAPPAEATEDFRLDALKRRLEEIATAAGTVEDRTDAVQRAMDGLGLSFEDLPPELRKIIFGMTKFLDLTDATGDAATEVKDELSDIIQRASVAARGGAELAAALGLAGDEAARVVSQVALIGDGIAQIQGGNILEGLGGIAGGIAGVIGSIVAAGPTQGEIERDDSLEANTRRLRQLNERIDVLAGVLRGLPGRIVDGIADGLRVPLSNLPDDLRSRESFPAVRASADAIAESLAAAGVSITDVERAAEALGIDADQLVRLLEGGDLGVAQLHEALEQAEALFDALDRGLSDVLESAAGRLDLLRTSFDVLDIEEPADQLKALVDELSRAGTALTPQEIQRLREGDEETIERIFEQLQAGAGRFTDLAAFGDLSFDQFLDLLSEIEGLQDRIATGDLGDEGDFQQVSAVNRLTVEQGDTLIALAGTRNFYLREIRDGVRGFEMFPTAIEEPLSIDPITVTDRTLNEAGRIEVTGTVTHVVEVQSDASGITPEAAEALGAGLADGLLDRDLADQVRRIRAGFGFGPTREQ